MFPFLTWGCQERSFTLAAGGDVSLARNPGLLLTREGAGVLFAKVKGALAADLATANLECGLALSVGNQPWAGPKDPRLTLQAPVASIAALAGVFDVLSLANNHVLDSGESGLRTTLKALDAKGIGHAGAGFGGRAYDPLILERSGREIAFLAFSQPFPEFKHPEEEAPIAVVRMPALLEAVHRAKMMVGNGLVIVSIHWGGEGDPDPNTYQRTLGRACIDAGADAVLGHHPHNLQGLERRGRGIIAYSLGNLLFDSGGNENRQSAVLRLTWLGASLPRAEILPIRLEGPARVPRTAAGSEANQILDDMIAKTNRLGGHLIVTSSETAFLE